MADFEESEHPRDKDGKFTSKGDQSSSNYQEEVNNRIKWAKENNIDIPLTSDGAVDDLKLQELYDSDTIKLPDEIVTKSVGAKWKNYKILMPDGGFAKLVEGSKIRNKEVFAGKGCKRKIDEVDNLVNKFGGSKENWQKVKALATIEYKGEQIDAELHWYEEPKVGKVKFKYKKGNL